MIDIKTLKPGNVVYMPYNKNKNYQYGQVDNELHMYYPDADDGDYLEDAIKDGAVIVHNHPWEVNK